MPELRRFGLFTLLALSVAVLLVTLGRQQQQECTPIDCTAADPSIGTVDNPNARVDYELLMLRDPQTGIIPPGIRQRERAFAASIPVRGRHGGSAVQGDEPVFKWIRRGPYNVGGRTRAVAIDVTNPSIIMAGGVSGGMWRSTDGGSSWRKTSAPSLFHSVTDVVQDTRAGMTHVWYYTTGEGLGNSASEVGAYFYGDGVFKSTDGGENWFQLESTVSNTPHRFDQAMDILWRVVVNPVAEGAGEVYIAAAGGIFRSTDGGENWTEVLQSQSSLYNDITVTASGVFYASLSSEGTNPGIYRSTDGLNWTKINPQEGFPTSFRRIISAAAPSNENTVYFYAYTPGEGLRDVSFWKYRFLSGDGSGDGGTWEARWHNLPALPGRGALNTQTSYNMVLKVLPTDENIVFIGGTTLFRSTDGFASIDNTTRIGGFAPTLGRYRDYPNHHPDQHNLVFYPDNPQRMLSSCDGGVFRTENNMAEVLSWESLNNGYYTSQFYTLAIDKKTPGSQTLIGGLQDRGTWFTESPEAARPWQRLHGADGGYCAVTEHGYYLSIQEGQILRYVLDEQNRKTDSARIDPIAGSNYLFISPFAVDPNEEKRIYTCAGGSLWRNNDVTRVPFGPLNATHIGWEQLSKPVLGQQLFSALAVCRTPAHRVYAASSGGIIIRIDEAHIGDPDFTVISAGKGLPSAYVNCLAVDPTNGDRLIAVFTNYNTRSLFYSDNAGETWADISGNLEENPDGSGAGPSTRWASILPLGDKTVYFVGTSTGLYSTIRLDGQNTVWRQEGPTEIGNVVVTAVESRPADGFVAIATHGAGMFSTSVVTDVAAATDITDSHIAMQYAAPNPFARQTSLHFTLREAADITLSIYDARGRIARRLYLHQYFAAGTHSLTLDAHERNGSTLGAGRYYAVLESRGYRSAIPLVIER